MENDGARTTDDDPQGTSNSSNSIQGLQTALANAKLDIAATKDDRAKIVEIMEMLKAKYAALLKEKTDQTQELITCEEDKLAVAKALVQLKLSYCELQEASEKEKFDNASAMLTLRNSMLDVSNKVRSFSSSQAVLA